MYPQSGDRRRENELQNVFKIAPQTSNSTHSKKKTRAQPSLAWDSLSPTTGTTDIFDWNSSEHNNSAHEKHDDELTRPVLSHCGLESDCPQGNDGVNRRAKKGNLKGSGEKQPLSRRVSFDPLALLLDASLEELDLVMRTAGQVRDPSAANDEGITVLHNAICAGHFEIVKFLVKFGCDVNALLMR